MGFASAWLNARAVFPEFIKEEPSAATGIVTVVPLFNEPSITDLLDSLAHCEIPSCGVEVIVVVNSPSDSEDEIVESNRAAQLKIESWKRNRNIFFRLFVFNIECPDIKNWGVGLARKAGMDEALRRFDKLDYPGGIITCLDADCTVRHDYFKAIESEFLSKNKRNACSIRFEHPVSGFVFEPEIYNSIIQYEIHLRYYYQALKYSGFPDVFHTVGSTIAVRAESYMKAGGMNRRQAGEDFYFVQKLIPAGGYFSLNSTVVYPSPRISDRVPFGTGNAIGKMISSGKQIFMTYNPEAFKDLKEFFLFSHGLLYEKGIRDEGKYSLVPYSVRTFLPFDEWKTKMDEIISNTASPAASEKRFFEWFNMFRIVKFLNFSHNMLFKRVSANEAAISLFRISGIDYSGQGDNDLLQFLRGLELN